MVKRPTLTTEDAPTEPEEVDLRKQSRERFLAMTEEERLAFIDKFGIEIVTDDFRD
jgi:hypothetical protein